MVLVHLANIGAGAYVGWMNSEGHSTPQPANLVPLAYVLGGTSLVSGVNGGLKAKRHHDYNKNHPSVVSTPGSISIRVDMTNYDDSISPVGYGIKEGLLSLPVGALEIAVGYGLACLAHKIIKG